MLTITDREDALQDDFQFAGGGGEDDEWDDADDGWVEDGGPAEATADVKDENTAYIEFLSEEAQKIERLRTTNESSDELGEESLLLESALDKIEPYQLFRNAISRKFSPALRILYLKYPVLTFRSAELEREQPQFYAGLVTHLSPEEQAIMESVYAQADREIQAAHNLYSEQQKLLAENGGGGVLPPS